MIIIGRLIVAEFKDNEEYPFNEIMKILNERSNPPAMLGRME